MLYFLTFEIAAPFSKSTCHQGLLLSLIARVHLVVFPSTALLATPPCSVGDWYVGLPDAKFGAEMSDIQKLIEITVVD